MYLDFEQLNLKVNSTQPSQIQQVSFLFETKGWGFIL
jgi:hypothetical protein